MDWIDCKDMVPEENKVVIAWDGENEVRGSVVYSSDKEGIALVVDEDRQWHYAFLWSEDVCNADLYCDSSTRSSSPKSRPSTPVTFDETRVITNTIKDSSEDTTQKNNNNEKDYYDLIKSYLPGMPDLSKMPGWDWLPSMPEIPHIPPRPNYITREDVMGWISMFYGIIYNGNGIYGLPHGYIPDGWSYMDYLELVQYAVGAINVIGRVVYQRALRDNAHRQNNQLNRREVGVP